MYEDITFQQILSRMLDRVPESMDKREGSVIYDMLAPLAMELRNMYFELGIFEDENFADTASTLHLRRRAAEFGVYPTPATAAVVKGEFNLDVPIGSRFNLDEINYAVESKLSDRVFRMRAETEGSAGNRTGTLVPISYITGLTNAEVTEILENGVDEESTDHFRSRFLFGIQKPSTSGNANHYRQWALEVSGVGDARVLPLWAGPGTVKVLVLDHDRQPAGEALMQDVAEYIETVRPVGAAVTVDKPKPVQVDVAATVSLAAGARLDDVKKLFEESIRKHLQEIVFQKNFVSLAVIGSLLLEVPGVLDYQGLTLNGSVENVRIELDQAPILRAVEVSV